MSHLRILLLCLALVILAQPTGAQDTAPSEAEGGEAEGANAVQVQEERLQALIATLEDEQQRQELVAQLRLMLEAQEQVAPPEETVSLGDQMLGQLSLQFEALGEAADAILSAPEQVVDFWVWLESDVATESGRSRWQDILRAVGISIGAAILAYFVLVYPLRRLGNRLARPDQSTLARLLSGTAGFIIDAVPVVAFAAVGSATLAAIGAGSVARVMTANLLSVITIALAVSAFIRILTRPRRPAMRLLPVSDAVARDLTRRLRWIVIVLAVAYAIGQTLPLIGMPWSTRSAVLTIAAVIAAAMLIRTILKHRLVLRYGLERSASPGTVFGDLIHWLARVWHVLAILLTIVLMIAYIVGGDDLFLTIVVQMGWTLLVAAGAYAIWHLARALSARQARKAQARAQVQDGETDADVVRRSGHVLLTLFAKVVLAAVVAGLLVHIWLFDVVEWFGADAGRDLLEAAVTIGIIVGLAFLANRAIATIIGRIQSSRSAGTAEQRNRRIETLLPLLRNAAAVIIITVTGLIVLSEIGLDITPLLASAGVIGLAIGFGAQSLVKDVITGLFILMEDAVGVGDVVTVAGYSGVVEEMSIRTIKLRDFGGVLHVIPFGVVDAASNMTRDFAFAVFDVGVAYNSDIDKVKEVMTQADEELRADPEIGPTILEPMQIFGVDSFGDNAIVVKARIKTRPGGQWTVLRTYNGILKKRFDAAGIEIPFPQRTLHLPKLELEELARVGASNRAKGRRKGSAKQVTSPDPVQSDAPIVDEED